MKSLQLIIVLCLAAQTAQAAPRCELVLSQDSRQDVLDKRGQLITGAQGKVFKINYSFKGEKKQIQGRFQPEWEAKLLFTQNKPGAASQKKMLLSILDSFGASVLFAGSRSNWGYKPDQMNKGPFWETEDFDGFYASPLSSKVDFFHDGHIVDGDSQFAIKSQKFSDESESKMWTKVIDGQDIYTRATNGTPEKLKMQHTVGYQHEEGTYFDTEDGQLQKQGVALRIKRWSPIGSNGRSSKAQAQTLFVKVDQDTQLDIKYTHAQQILRHRNEYQIPLPLEISEQEIAVIMEKFLKQLKIEVDAKAIKVYNKVSNDRYGINLMYRKYHSGEDRRNEEETPDDQKVGFLTIDRYSLSSNPEKEYQQVEVEVFPEFVQLYTEEALSFSAFWKDLIRELPKGDAVITPKYLQDN